MTVWGEGERGWGRPIGRDRSLAEFGPVEHAVIRVLRDHAEANRTLGHEHLGGWLNGDLLTVAVRAHHPARARSVRRAVARLIEAGEVEVAMVGPDWAYRTAENATQGR